MRHYPTALVTPCTHAILDELVHVMKLLLNNTGSRWLISPASPPDYPVADSPLGDLLAWARQTIPSVLSLAADPWRSSEEGGQGNPLPSPDQGDLSTFYFAICVLRCLDCMTMGDDYQEIQGSEQHAKHNKNAVMIRLEQFFNTINRFGRFDHPLLGYDIKGGESATTLTILSFVYGSLGSNSYLLTSLACRWVPIPASNVTTRHPNPSPNRYETGLLPCLYQSILTLTLA